jgi:outer membrane lipoprotein-sorting protein
MTVERVIENPKLTDEQFQIKMPDGVKVQTLE